jgi:SRF-type transcription factor (DNA-binding and dimerisation domain)
MEQALYIFNRDAMLTRYFQAYELSVLTGTQVLLLVVSETGLVYTFTTPKLQPLVTKAEGKNLIQVSLHILNTRILLTSSTGMPQRSRAIRCREWG